MNLNEFKLISSHELSQVTNSRMGHLFELFRKAEFIEVKSLAKDFVRNTDDKDILSLAKNYTECLNFGWPEEIKGLPLEAYPVIELICEEYGSKTCEFLDYILFENDHHLLDIRHLHSGAIHLLVILALRNVRRKETIEKINNHQDSIYYFYDRTYAIFKSLTQDDSSAGAHL